MNANPIRPNVDERDELVRLLPELVERDLPSDRQRQLREFVMSQIHQDLRTVEQVPRRAPKRRIVLATSGLAAAAVAAVAVAVAVGAGGLGVDRGTGGSTAAPGTAGSTASALSPVAQTFELAAANAAAKPFTPPRPNQWIYIQNRNLATGSIAKDKGQRPDVTTQVWLRVDGRKMAGFNEMTGKLDTWNQDNGYPTLSTLPTDPQELLSLLRDQVQATAPPAPGGRPLPLVASHSPDEWDGVLFRRIAGILANNLLPSDVTAALWRAAALIPGVTQESVEVDGRQLTAVGRIQDGWQFEQLLLDPDTHEFVGYRAVAVKDYTYPYSPSGPISIKKGEAQFEIIRLAATIVDAPGQTS